MTIYNIINPQRQRTKLGISALNAASPAAPHPTGELVKCSSKSKIYESYSKIWVLNSSVQSRQSVQPPLQQNSLKIGIFRISTDTFQLEIPLQIPSGDLSAGTAGHPPAPVGDSSVSPQIHRQKDNCWLPFPQILPNLSTLLLQLSAAEQRFCSSKAPVTHPSLKSGDVIEFLWKSTWFILPAQAAASS